MSTERRRSDDSRRTHSYAGRSRASKSRATRARNSYPSAGNGRRGGKGGRRKDHSVLILTAILAVLVIVAGVLVVNRGRTGTSDDTAADTLEIADESTVNTDVIDRDLYVDYSAIAGDGALLNLKGMNEAEAEKALKSKYTWSLKVTNTNPNLDSFTMPDLPDKVDAASETGADADGTVYEVKVDNALANVTIRPSKESFEVPDAVGSEIDSLLATIYEDYGKGAGKDKTSDSSDVSTSDAAGSDTKAEYTLRIPDYTDTAKDYAGQLAAIWDDKPKNGDITSFDKESGKFKFGGSEDGYTFDSDQIAKDLADAVNNRKFTDEIKAAGAVVTADNSSVKDKYKTISTYTTNTTSNAVRNKNIRLACEAVDGTVLKPGAEFSYNDVVGERTEAKGYGAAGAYNNGEVVQEIGGGVCQLSSTLFNAVYRAGLTTTYRRSHTFEPSYVTPGMDATVSWGGPDYRFVNNSDHAIGIRASYSNQTCTVSIYGVPILEDGVTWTMESNKVKDLPLEDPQIITSGTPSKGTQGSEWEVYKIVKKNGEEVSRTLDHKTTYKGHRPTKYADEARTTTAAAETTTAPETTRAPETTTAAETKRETTTAAATEAPKGPSNETAKSTTAASGTAAAPTAAPVTAPTAAETAAEAEGPGA